MALNGVDMIAMALAACLKFSAGKRYSTGDLLKVNSPGWMLNLMDNILTWKGSSRYRSLATATDKFTDFS